jgi:hypothetical protein
MNSESNYFAEEMASIMNEENNSRITTCQDCQCEFKRTAYYCDQNLCAFCERIRILESELKNIFGKKVILLRNMKEDYQCQGEFPNGKKAIFSDSEVVMNPNADSLNWIWEIATEINILKAATGCWDIK